MRRKTLTLSLAAILALVLLAGTGLPSRADESAGEAGATDGAGKPATEYKFKKGAEKFAFQAEVNRLMDILINSLYSNKDIFLRELISNASDALDKIRLLALKDKSQLGDKEDLEIRISLDHDKRRLTIRDTGVGMTKADLINNLGTIAKSGTSAFLETLQKGGDVNLIGQFGVGFYSVYLVADYVEVVSKHNDDAQWVWESKADGNFALSQDTEGEPLGRGTQINIYLKEETQEYASEAKLRELVQKYSEFINFPIYLYDSKEIEVPAKEEEASAKTKSDDEISDEDEEADEEAEEEDSAPKTVKKTVWDWELLNDNKPIWLRSPSEVSEEEYTKFFQALSKQSSSEPLAHVHFKGEGDVEFRSILFIPSVAPPGLLDNYYGQQHGLDLYVRRVFITNNFEELVPRYLGFLKGLVDSDTLPLSVSREALQEHAALKVIKKKVVRKTLDTLKQLAESDKETADGEEEGGKAKAGGKYDKFWGEFGKMLKLGVIEDGSNRQRLAKLLRFKTSKSPAKLTSLEEYIERMQPKQKHIYFITGESQKELEQSPFLEKLFDRDYEVIYFTDAVDEYVMQHLTEFDEHKFQNAAKENLKLGEKDEKEKKKEKALREAFKPLVQWWRELLGAGVSSVKVSRRLAKSPAIVVSGQYGMSANMERIMRAQAVGDGKKDFSGFGGQKILEVNPRHPLVEELKKLFEKDKDSASAKAMARVIFDTALLESGYPLDNPKAFNERVYEILAKSLNVKSDVTKGVEFDKSLDQDEDAEDGEGESESNEEFIDRIVKEHKEKLEEEKDEL